MKLLHNISIITPFTRIPRGFLVIEEGTIFFVGDEKKDSDEFARFNTQADKVIDGSEKIAVPGFIDIHTHGSLGKDYSASPDLLEEDALFRVTQGVTGYLPTVSAFVPPEKLLESAGELARRIRGWNKNPGANSEEGDNTKGATPLGVNLEGPCLRPDLGAQPDEYCFWEIDLDYIQRAIEEVGDEFSIMTIAPELKNGLETISLLKRNGVIPSIGHTLATEEVLDKAIRRGANLVTHLCNTTYQPEQDLKGIMKTGANEYLMVRDDVTAEAIMDLQGIHINPTMAKILLRTKGVDKTIVITDSFITPGTEKGKTYLMPNGQEVYEEKGVNIQVLNKHVSGSAMTMDMAVRSLIMHTGLSLEEAVRTVTVNPACLLGLSEEGGSLEVGKRADITLIDEDITVYTTYVGGDLAYSRS